MTFSSGQTTEQGLIEQPAEVNTSLRSLILAFYLLNSALSFFSPHLEAACKYFPAAPQLREHMADALMAPVLPALTNSAENKAGP